MNSTRDALHRYIKRTQPNTRRKKNHAPEKVVEKQVLAWLSGQGFCVSVVESKAHYSKAAGAYLGQSAPSGFPDIVGNDRHGRAIYIELKAPGKLSTVRPAQVLFLLRKIETNCFACVIDSLERLQELYQFWDQTVERDARENYLRSRLPKKAIIKQMPNDGPLFED